MGPTYQFQSVNLIEVFGYFFTKEPPRASHIVGPQIYLIWVGPHQIGIGSIHRDFLFSINSPDLVYCLYFWGQSTVDAQHPAVNECSYRQAVKNICEKLPGGWVAVFPADFIVKTIGHGNVSALMISSEKSNFPRVFYLQTE